MAEEEVLHEFPKIDKYRIRVIRPRTTGRNQKPAPVLDIREYVVAEKFEGFTRRGVRLKISEVHDLRTVVEDFEDRLGNEEFS